MVCNMVKLETNRVANHNVNEYVNFVLFQTEIVAKLRDKENAYINRINKIHKVAD